MRFVNAGLIFLVSTYGVVGQRDRMERALEDWTAVSSRTSDPVGVRQAMDRLDKRLKEIKLNKLPLPVFFPEM